MQSMVIWWLGCTAFDAASALSEPTPSERIVPGTPAAPVAAPVPVAAPEPPEPPTPDLARHQRPPPPGWVDLRKAVPGARFDVRYHTIDNFTGAPLPGYGVPGAWLQQPAAEALARVQARLEKQGKGLLIYDAYRPLRGTLAMVAWAKRTDQVHLLDGGYIARRSGHNKGNTIDLSVVDLATGEEIDMGTPWDTLSEVSHTKNAKGTALANRMLLREAMHAEGYRNYWREWWHFSFAMEGQLLHRDVPYACFEPAEGGWSAPEGWAAAGYVAPSTYTIATDCVGGG